MSQDQTPPGRMFTAADVAGQLLLGQLAVHGDRIVYTLRRMHLGGDRIGLWTVNYRTGGPEPLTEGPDQDYCPRISPDGATLAFLRTTGDEPAQLWLLELDHGTARPLTRFGRGVYDAAWSPDGSWLAVLAENDRSALMHRAPDVPPELTATALVLTRTDWRRDGELDGGHRLYARHLHRVPIDGGPVRRLTAGAWSASRPRVDATGQVYFLADTGPEPDLEPAPQLHRVGGDVPGCVQVTDFAGGVVRYHLTPTGFRVLARAGAEPAEDVPARLYDVTAAGAAHELLPGVDRWFGLLGDESDLHDWSLELDDAADLTTASWDGSSAPIIADSGVRLVAGPVSCGALAQDGDRRVGVLALGAGVQAPDVYALEAAGPRRLTEHGRWLAPFRRPRWERRVVAGPAGQITVHLLHPLEGTAPHRTVLAVHGGPTGQWGVVPTLEAYLLASAGYLVVMPNIRGSIDRGRAWVGALRGAWGEVDAQDCHAVCDALVEGGLIDPDRLGVSGLSYGGFLAQWLVGTSDRFAAAVSENGVSNQVSAWANCDTGPAYCRSSDLGDVLSPAGVQRLWAASPLRQVAGVHTPLLMLQAADDRICPASDNEQFFLALRALRRVVEYVVYPEESHLMQAVGRVDRRIDRHTRALAWFDRYVAS